MPSFFHRLRMRLIRQNRFIGYLKYAIGEIVLVVIGILLALQINNWNKARINNNLKQEYLLRLIDDLQEDKAILQATLNYSLTVHSHAKKAVVILEKPDQALKDPVNSLVHLYQSSQLQTPAAVKSTYLELISSGQINLLKNTPLKTSLIRYYEYDWAVSNTMALLNDYREALRSKMADPIQDKIRKECGDKYFKIRDTYEVMLPKDCTIFLDEKAAKKAVQDITKVENLKEKLRVHISNLEAKIEFMKQVKKIQEKLIKELEAVV
ncbi:DUF6090 family protein [Salinimicrobium soli]|uniref:DUF6090 family protein n=1 Tax=Salinimicrobium soli TaxID=1254399 RepID=UPI003AAFDAC8